MDSFFHTIMFGAIKRIYYLCTNVLTKHHNSMKKFIITTVIVIAVIALAVAFLTAPMGKEYVNSHGEELIGRKIYVEDFKFNILNGNVSLDDIVIYEKNGDSVFVKIDDLDLDLSLMGLLHGNISIDKLDIDGAVVNVVQKDSTFNYDDIVAFMSEGESHEYKIGSLRADDVEINYLDRSFPEVPFRYAIHDMEVEADDFTTTGRNHIDIEAELGTGGEAKLTYEGTLADQDNINVSLSMKKVALTDFTPLFTQIFGREVLSGTLDMQTEMTVKNGNVDGKNKIVIKDPKVEKVKDLSFKPEYRHLPLKTILYFMIDRDGKCELDIPVTGNRNNPSFSYKRTVMRMLGKSLGRIVLGKHKDAEE